MRRAFTFFEVVVVVLVLGILAGIAAPRYFDVASTSVDNGLRQSLAIVRDAIDMHQAATGRLPGEDGSETTFKAELAPYLREFPALPVGPDAARNATVAMDASVAPISGDASPTEGWRYYFNVGVFIANWNAPVASDASINYDDL